MRLYKSKARIRSDKGGEEERWLKMEKAEEVLLLWIKLKEKQSPVMEEE